jgi:hypothetical protein
MPVRVTPDAVVEIFEMLTAALPVFVTTTCLELVVPVPIVPKLRLAGFALNCPVAAAEPVPLKGTVTVGFTESLLVMDKLPVALPEAPGVNVTPICAD